MRKREAGIMGDPKGDPKGDQSRLFAIPVTAVSVMRLE
jgi:hypothetical protein